jgi:hypothetical protein
MTNPNFFILGGPKCGTTALYEYLVTHPRIFMSSQKEIHYFSDDVLVIPGHLSENRYLELFQEATPEHLAVGEASVFYLYSPRAVTRILEFNPEARMIAMVRNPIDMAYSFHQQLLWSTVEEVEDFAEAWHLQAERRAHRRLPARYRRDDPRVDYLQYADICRLGTQIGRLLDLAPHGQVKIVVFDDFVRDTQRVYEEVLAFLSVPSDAKTSFPRINENKVFKNTWARTLKSRIVNLPPPIRRTVDFVKRTTGIRDFGIYRRSVRLLNRQFEATKRPDLDSAFREELREHFRPEIAKLEEALDRDFSHWQ